MSSGARTGSAAVRKRDTAVTNVMDEIPDGC
jgi:hypothetical protein